ncbi:MAG: polyprenyl synthetase family protein [Candidatus Bathyarchaeota archaeon]|nr:MAG: polyprenyl synthetase family protein [Candidatus Bathyarchaeota archaeon]
MALNEAINRKLSESASQVDQYIYELLKPRKPEALYEASRHIFQAGGKRLRPYLVLKSCELVGGDPDVALPFAAAMEILHNFTLVHDDIMDNDALRRGAPTVHAKWGVPVAIASGDLLFAKVYEAIVRASIEGNLTCDNVLACIERVNYATMAICEGQVLDVTYPRTVDVSEEDYVFMVGGKTSALFKACAEVGAIIGGGDSEQVERVGSFAWNAGIAFQIVDDILGATADEKTLGKPVGSDLREGKKTLIVIHALENATSEGRDAILKVLDVEDATPSEIKAATKALVDSGAINYAKERAENCAGRAKEMLEIFPDSVAKNDLLELVEYFTQRTF